MCEGPNLILTKRKKKKRAGFGEVIIQGRRKSKIMLNSNKLDLPSLDLQRYVETQHIPLPYFKSS